MVSRQGNRGGAFTGLMGFGAIVTGLILILVVLATKPREFTTGVYLGKGKVVGINQNAPYETSKRRSVLCYPVVEYTDASGKIRELSSVWAPVGYFQLGDEVQVSKRGDVVTIADKQLVAIGLLMGLFPGALAVAIGIGLLKLSANASTTLTPAEKNQRERSIF